jgi:hypothetical protein
MLVAILMNLCGLDHHYPIYPTTAPQCFMLFSEVTGDILERFQIEVVSEHFD